MARVTENFQPTSRTKIGETWVFDGGRPSYLDGIEAQYCVYRKEKSGDYGTPVAYVFDLPDAVLIADALNAKVAK